MQPTESVCSMRLTAKKYERIGIAIISTIYIHASVINLPRLGLMRSLKEVNITFGMLVCYKHSLADTSDYLLWCICNETIALQKLRLCYLTHITDAGIQIALNRASRLQSLTIYNCGRLTDASLFSVSETGSCTHTV